MVLQSSFGSSFATGYPGMLANAEVQNRITRTIEDAAGVGFGLAVFRGVGDHGVTKTPGTPLLGITIVDHGLVRATGGTADTYPQYAEVPILQRGAIKVLAGENVNDGDPVYVTAGGAFMKTAAGNTALAGWVFDATVASGGIVVVTNNRS